MKDYEAKELGFEYTGMSAPAYDKTKWEEEKVRAQEIKKTYKGADFRVVDERCRTRYGSELWKNIYGNKIFIKALDFNPEDELRIINESIPQRIERIRKEAEEAIQKALDDQKKRQENYNYLVSLRK